MYFGNYRPVKDMVKQKSKRSRFRRLFNKQHGQRTENLLKSPRQHLYHLY